MADNLTYQTPDVPVEQQLERNAVVPPIPALQPLGDFISQPVTYMQQRPNLQFKFEEPLKREADRKANADALNAKFRREIQNQPYNKFNTEPIKYDKRDAQLYTDPQKGYIPGRDNETFYDVDQSIWRDMGRNTVGFLANVTGTALNTIPSTISGISATVNWAMNGFDSKAFSIAYDNPISVSLNKWMNDVQQNNYNYRNERERELAKNNPLLNLIPFYGNGFGDAIRSVGYGVGSILGILGEEALIGLATGGTGVIPSLSAKLGNLVRIGRLGSKVENALDVARSLDNLQDVVRATYQSGRNAERFNNILRAGRPILSSLGEASFEATETKDNLLNNLIEDYRQRVGVDPDSDTISRMSQASTDAANARYLLNVAVLSLSNSVQFDGLFKTFPMSKYFLNESKKQTIGLGEFGFKTLIQEKIVEPWYKSFGKAALRNIGEGVKRSSPEAIEEGLQFAIDKGTSYYAEKKYQGKDELSTVYDAVIKGLKDTVTTTEGWNNMLQGFIGGEIQGRAVNLLEKRGQAERDRIGASQRELLLSLGSQNFMGEDGSIDSEKVKTFFNVDSIGGTAIDKINSVTSQVGSQKQARASVENNDRLSFQSAKDDLQFGFIQSFVMHNQKDSLDDIIDNWRDQINNDFDGFKTQFGLDTSSTTKEAVLDSLVSLNNKANDLKLKYDRINLAFPNVQKPKTSAYVKYNEYKQELVYQLFKYERYKDRYNELKEKNIQFSHLENVFKGKEFRRKLEAKKDEVELFLETANSSDGISKDLNYQMKQNDLKNLKDTLSILDNINEDLSKKEAQRLMEATDRLFGSGELQNESNIDEILNDISDMVRLQNNSNNSLETYKLLSDVNGFKRFVEEEEKLSKKAEENLKKIREENAKRLAEEQKQNDLNQRRQEARNQYGPQFEDLSSVTGQPIEEIVNEFVDSNSEIDDFVLRKLPIEQPENQIENESQPQDQETENTQTEEPESDIDAARRDPNTLKNKFIKYDSGSSTGTKGWRQVIEVGETQGNTTELTAIEFNEDGTIKDTTKKKYALQSEKLIDVTKGNEETNNLKRQTEERLIPPSQPEEKETGRKSSSVFSSFFILPTSLVDVYKKIISFISPKEEDIKLSVTLTKIKEPNLKTFLQKKSKTFENKDWIVNTDVTTNLHQTKNGVLTGMRYGFRLDTKDSNDLGYFLPLSSFYYYKKGTNPTPEQRRTHTLYDLVKKYLSGNETAKNMLETFIEGDLSELVTTYHLENILKRFADSGKTSISLKDINSELQRLGLKPIVLKSFYRGANAALSFKEDGEYPTLKQIMEPLNPNMAFVYVDSEGPKLFNGSTLTKEEVDKALNSRRNLIDPSTNRSRISSYTLLMRDSSGYWTALPVKTIPVTNSNQKERKRNVEDLIKAKSVQDFQNMTPEEIMRFLNEQLFYQDNKIKGHFNLSSNGRLEFYFSSLFKDQISRGGNLVGDDQKITVYLDQNASNGIAYDFTNFNFEDFADKLNEVTQRLSGYNTKVDVGNFRFKEGFGKKSADEFNDFRVIADSKIPFRTINISYTQKAKKNDQKDKQRVPSQVGIGQESQQTQPEQSTSREETQTSGVLQTQEELEKLALSKPDHKIINENASLKEAAIIYPIGRSGLKGISPQNQLKFNQGGIDYFAVRLIGDSELLELYQDASRYLRDPRKNPSVDLSKLNKYGFKSNSDIVNYFKSLVKNYRSKNDEIAVVLGSKPIEVISVDTIDKPDNISNISNVSSIPAFFLSVPNKDGSFIHTLSKFSPDSGLYEARETQNGFEVSIINHPVVDSEMKRSPEAYLERIMDIEGDIDTSKGFEMIEPAIYKKEDGIMKLVKRGRVKAVKSKIYSRIDSPSLKISQEQLNFLVQKALRECSQTV